MILVVGASGSLGGMIAQRLLAQGKKVRILTRGNALVSSIVEAGAEPVDGDLKEPASLIGALNGVTTVITTANAAMRAGVGAGKDTLESVDLEGNQHLIDAAVAAGVKQFIFTSAFIADANSPVAFIY